MSTPWKAASNSRKVYVSKGGNDSTADGTLILPFLTILAALNSITDACTPDADGNPKQYTVMIGQGTYTETADNLLRSGIFLQGEMDFQNGQHEGTELVQILTVDTNPVIGTAVNSAFPCTGAANLFFGTGIDLSASPIGTENTCYLQNCNIAGNGIANDGTVNGVSFQLNNCVTSGVTLNWGNLAATLTQFDGAIACTATTLGSTFIFLYDCSSPNGTLALDTTASTSEYVVGLYSSYIGSITAANTGASGTCAITSDLDSIPVKRLVTIDSSVALNLLNDAYFLNYINATSTTTVGAILDQILSGQIIGTNTNDDAIAGNVGEFVNSLVPIGSGIALTTATPTDVTSITLSAGDWDVEGCVNLDYTTGTFTIDEAGLSVTSATMPTDGSEAYLGYKANSTTISGSIPLTRKRVSLATPANVYLVVKSTFTVGSVIAYGQISARRVR
jgi:hypothetical protein